MVSEAPSNKGCELCSAVHRPLVCPDCVNNVVLGENKAALLALIKKRDEVLVRLKEKMEKQVVLQDQEATRQLHLLELRKVSKRATAAEQRWKQVMASMAVLRDSSKARQTQVDDASAQLLDKRKEKLHRYFPVHSRVTDLTYSCARSSLEEEWCAKVRQLLEVLPLRINALRSETKAPIQVTVCNLQLPNGPISASNLKQKPEALDAALGYALLLLDLLGLYTGGPVTHQSSFKGSSSYIWQPRSYWDRRPASSGDVLPLHIGRSPPTQLSASNWPSTSGDQPSPRCRRQMEDGLRLLHRSIGTFSACQLGPLGAKLPEGWSPFASLAWICSEVARDSLRGALQQLGSVPLQDSRLCTNGSRMRIDDSYVSRYPEATQLLLPDDDDDQVDDEGWCCVRSTLPPPPSQPDDVEHWTRAVLTDNRSGWQRLRLNMLRPWPVRGLNGT